MKGIQREKNELATRIKNHVGIQLSVILTAGKKKTAAAVLKEVCDP